MRSAVCLLIVALAAQPARAERAWEVFFSPRGGAERAAVRALTNAKRSVFVQAYSFTNTAIARALVDAHRRGIDVEVILDRSNRTAHYSAATFLGNAGISTAIDAAHEIAHNKIMVVDEEVVITGSFNFTNSAETRNAENLLVIRDRELAARYLANWRLHRAHSH
jgi:phosphatidylserine/phosphatidylglycerophosphate/cardiolipin synthase-like enzyme